MIYKVVKLHPSLPFQLPSDLAPRLVPTDFSKASVENPQGLDNYKLLLRTLPPSLEPQGKDARRSGFSEAIRYLDWTR